MRIRRNFLPHTIPDIAATLFLAICIPITFWFEIIIVLPEFHSIGSFLYNITFIAGIFLVFNINANMLAIMLYDTSIKGEILKPPDKEEEKRLWRLCSICETLSPPRSWHCNTCNTCILKRDHHCVFTGCCIGHKNHRFFLMLIAFLFIGTAYASIYNNIFIWYLHGDIYYTWSTFLKMIFPLFMLIIDISQGNFYLAIYEINMIGVAFTFLLLLYHGNIILKGSVVHERKSQEYDLGWKRNIQMVLGEKWYLTWISPFIGSRQPHDGIHWEEFRMNSIKNK